MAARNVSRCRKHWLEGHSFNLRRRSLTITVVCARGTIRARHSQATGPLKDAVNSRYLALPSIGLYTSGVRQRHLSEGRDHHAYSRSPAKHLASSS